ncbi:MAG TPA: hypothetical protein VMS98_05875 [Thermoanaerobaculia bacterium]|nr:hypothetical protein [Thermoanaerobaculia bacterium]
MRILPLIFASILIASCATMDTTGITNQLNTASGQYVRLVLALGEHDADYVDAYYGPPAVREEVKASKPSLDDIFARATALHTGLGAIPQPADRLVALRHEYLRRQTEALIARAEMLRGRRFTFDQESRALYDAEAPVNGEEYFQRLNAELERELPGDGPLIDRLEAFRNRFVIPKDKLDAVFQAAIEGCRERTMQHIDLPPGESFTVEYVTNKSWSGYNWYQGNFRSLIQVNTDLPIFMDRAVDLACHEGYPGHHVYNLLLEKHMVKDRGWMEFTVYPLFSPQSFIAEGSANYGIEVAFPADERVKFEIEKLYPIAGLDPGGAEKFNRVQQLAAKTSYAGNEAARRYLNGEITAAEAAEWMTKYGLMGPERARQRVRFIDQYRSYVINYNLGKDLVRQYVERHAKGDRQRRWDVFEELLSTPRLPSALAR